MVALLALITTLWLCSTIVSTALLQPVNWVLAAVSLYVLSEPEFKPEPS